MYDSASIEKNLKESGQGSTGVIVFPLDISRNHGINERLVGICCFSSAAICILFCRLHVFHLNMRRELSHDIPFPYVSLQKKILLFITFANVSMSPDVEPLVG
jgi:hypothetical protein